MSKRMQVSDDIKKIVEYHPNLVARRRCLNPSCMWACVRVCASYPPICWDDGVHCWSGWKVQVSRKIFAVASKATELAIK